MTDQQAISGEFNGQTAQYEIWFRSIGFDAHTFRGLSEHLDKEIIEKKLGMESGWMGFTNSEYVEIMKPGDTSGTIVDSRFQAVGVMPDPEHPTGFKRGGGVDGISPARFVALASGTRGTPYEQDPLFHDDAHFDQEQYPGQLQGVDDPDENMLVATVNEEQMLQIKLAMLNATIEINEDNPAFGMPGWFDINSNGYRNTMGNIIEETVGKLNSETGSGIKVDTDFDPDGWSLGSEGELPTSAIELFDGSLEDLQNAVSSAELKLSGQLETLRSDIDADLTETSTTAPIGKHVFKNESLL